jgi:hypothetical protein
MSRIDLPARSCLPPSAGGSLAYWGRMIAAVGALPANFGPAGRVMLLLTPRDWARQHHVRPPCDRGPALHLTLKM